MGSVVSTIFPAVAPSASGARRFVVSALRREGVSSDRVDLAALLTSELVTNAFLHAGTETRVTVRVDHVIRIEVFDAGSGGVAMQSAAVDATRGRGLQIVDALADEWGHDETADGAHVWFELAREPAPAPG
jgi:anti-sigma regulatory factor (Ser/Thr protein kinase)